MSFHTHARQVRSATTFGRRRGAFRSCVGCYRWLTKQPFPATYERYSRHFGLTEDTPDSAERFCLAIDALETERRLFLERLREFDRRRIREKLRGCRTPCKMAVEALYGEMRFVVPDIVQEA